ncbi:MAG: PspC domain-containing protein [Anaerolineae bacterium]|jgi:phage shock protein C|nr:PspC domain-containing protein [Anaerolineae bacterium]MBT7074548.1 PspC domain-containing protein [Anaerolineae bacterium]MBT7782707.1 PspC domain-containing protein [Anaerolineae bacterium]
MKTHLYRSESNRMLGGVCGGLGDYLALDPIFIRLFFVLLFFGQGSGMLIYFILWVIMPNESNIQEGKGLEDNIKDSAKNFGERVQTIGQEFGEAMRSPNPQAGMIVGIALVALGGVLFIEKLGIYSLRWISPDILWPALLIIGGVVILQRRTRAIKS